MMKKLLQVIHFLLNNKAIIDRFDLTEKTDTTKQENSCIYFGMAKLFFSLILILVLTSMAWSQTQTFYYTGSNQTFTVPTGVTSITVAVWGAGGSGGGTRSNPNAGGGGEGGSFVRGTISVTPNTNYTIYVGGGGTGDTRDGSAGEISYVSQSGTTIFSAIGGSGGLQGDNFGNGGSSTNSGNIASGISISNYYGGTGGIGTNASTASSGGGGGSAGAGGDGGNGGSPLTGGIAGAGGTPSAPGAAGAVGRGSQNDGNGNDGNIPGGGGSGARNANNGTNYVGGNGANGQVIITWSSCPTYSITSTTATPVICAGSSSLISLFNTTASNLPVGSYTVTYDFSGSYTATGLTANMNVTSAGSGAFTTSSIPNVGNTSITITKLELGSCNNVVSSNNTASTFVAGSGTWLGTTSTDWNIASNWCGGIPTATTDVTIPSAAVNQPVIGLTGGLCRDININNGASLTISGSNSLTVSGNWTNNGSFTPNTSTVEYNGSSQTIGSVDYFNLMLSGSGTKTLQTGTKNIGGNFTMAGNATTTSAVVELNIGGNVYLETNTFFTSGAFTHNVGGNWTNNGWGATFTPGTGTINFTGNDAIINGTNATQNFNNIIISKTAGQTLSLGGSTTTLTVGGTFTETSGNFAAPATMSVGGDLTLTSGTFSVGSNLIVSGNWVNDGVTFNPGTGTVTMSGVTKTIGGTASTAFSNLTIGNAARIVLANNQAVNGELTLANGVLNLGAYNLTLGASSSISASSFYTTNMIAADGTGELRKIFTGAGSFMFPIGDNSDGTANYSPMTISFASGTFAGGAYAGVRVTDAKHPNNTSTTNYLSRYWTVSQSDITSFSSTVTGNYEYGADISGQEYLQNAAEYTGSLPWNTYAALASSTLTASGVTAFGDFTGMEVPTISVSPGSLSGFTYILGSGPSAQQQFTLNGVNLSADLIITPPADFEISSGSGFQSTPITLTQSGGIVNNTVIYTRLKAGLSVGNYNSGNVVVSSTGKTSQNVTLSGSVTSLSTGTAFWYKADGATPYGSNKWIDETTNNNDATRTGGTVSLANNTVNFNPSLTFTGVIQGMQIANSTSVQSFIVVNNPTTGSMIQAGGLIGATPDLGIRLNASKNAWRENDNNNDWAYSNLSGAGGRINGVSGFGFSGWNIVNQNHGSANDSRYYIGGYYTGRSYSGSIAEIIAFSGAVPEQDRVETYLALKYGITLGSTSNAINYINPSGSVIWEGSNTYQNDVAGLGSDGAYGLNQKVSSSINVASGSARVVMATTNDFTAPNLSGSRTALANGQYLIWGHNNLAVGALITDGGFDRVSRIWKVQNTGVSSNINLQIDLNGFPAPLPGLNLMLDNDANFDNGVTTIVPLTNSSGTLYAASVNFPAGTSYFTIGKCKSVSVTVNSPVICDGSGGATIIASPTPAGTYNYSWTVPGGATNPGNVNSFTATIQGTYNVEITNIGGCIASGSGNLTVNPKPIITLSSNTSICEGGSTILTAGGGTSYSWSPTSGLSSTSGSSVTANPSTTITYTVTGTDDNGCSNTAQVTVTVNSNPTVSSEPANQNITYGADASFTVVALNATSYQWEEYIGSTWNSITNAGVYSGANTATLNLTKPIVSIGGRKYRCLVTGGCGTVYSDGNATLTVEKATPTATLAVNNSPIIYDGTAKSATVGITASTVSGLVSNILTGGVANQINANSYSVTADFVPTDATNYNTLSLSAGNFVIEKATPILSVTNSTVTYSGTAQSATVSGSVAGTVSNILTGGAANQTDANSYSVTADFVPADAINYNSLTGASAGNFVISKIAPVISVDNTPQNYTGSPISAIVSVTGGGIVSNINYGGSITVPTDAGTYAITADIAASTNYTAVTGASVGSFVINKISLVITATDQSKCFGQTLIFTGTEFSSTGLILGDAITSVTLSSSGSGSGAITGIHKIFPSDAIGTGLSNYAITYSSAGILTVNDLPTGTLSNNGSICAGASTSLTFTKTLGVGPFDLVINGTTYSNIASGGTINISPTDLSTTYTLTSITDKGVSPNCSNTVNVSTTVSVYPIEVNATIGLAQACYNTVGEAFAKINDGTHKGAIIIKVHNSTTEPVSAFLNASSGSSSYISVLLYPTASGLSIIGNLNAPLIDLIGADFVTIDGRVDATGTSKDLTISNSSATDAASTIKFGSDASTNNVQYCTIQGSSTVSAIGTILFSTGTINGNDGNTIANNTITPAGINLPVNAIYSAGTSTAINNSGNTIDGNNISDFLRNGIFIASGSSLWTISSNSLYNGSVVSSTNFAANTDFYGIRVVGGSGYIISGNYIGGSAVNAGGSNAVYGSTIGRIGFYGISLGTATTVTKSEIKSNTIAGITINSVPTASSAVAFYGIETSGSNVVIGGENDADGNMIGSASGNGSIAITTYTTAVGNTSLIRGISSGGAKGTDGIIKNNKIGGIDISNIGSTAAFAAPSIFLGIYAANATAPDIIANAIGLSQTESIRVLSTSQAIATTLTGISLALGTNSIAIDGNTIQNISRLNTTNTTGALTGILSTAVANSVVSINNNTVKNIFVENSTTGTISGITNSSTAGTNTEASITNNTLDNFNVKKFDTGSTSSFYLIGIQNTTNIKNLNITGNTLKNFITPSTTGKINFIRNSGTVVTTININNNFLGVTNTPLVTFLAANAGAHIFINNTAGGPTSALSIKENDFRGVSYSGSNGTGANTFILNSAATLSQDISGNKFTDLKVKTSGSITFISNSVIMPATGSQIVSGNNIVTGFNKSAAGGTVTLFTSTAATVAAGVTVTHQNNNFSNITVTGTTTIAGWVHTDSGASAKTFSGNTFDNWGGGGSPITGMWINGGASGSTITGNTFSNFSTTGAITGLISGVSGTYNISGNNINNFSGGGIVIGYSIPAAASTITFDNNTIQNLSTTAGGTRTISGILAAGASSLTISNNTINEIQSTGVLTGNGSVRGIVNSGAGSVTINSNNISNIKGNSATTGSVSGILLSAGTIVNAYLNTIYGLQGNSITSGTINGLSITGAASSSVNAYQNKIFSLTSSNSLLTGTINGVLISGSITSLNVALSNNIIGELGASSVNNNTDAIRGISVLNNGTGSNTYLYFNTVNLSASSSGTNFGSTGVYHSSTGSALTMINNIITNNSVPKGSGRTVAYRRSSAVNTNYTSSSDNNSFYAGTPGVNNLIYNDGTNSDQTLQAYQTRVAPRDQASVTVNPVFLSTTGSDSNFLHLDAANCELDGTGKPVLGFTIDFDNETRDVLVPDIGADEFIGSPKLQVSVTVAADPSGPVCSGKSVTFTATPVNGGSSPTYQWYNGVTPISGQTGVSYTTTTLVNGDNIAVKLTSNAACVKDNPATSVAVAMVVNVLPVPVITGDASPCNEAVEVIYKTEPNMDLYVWTVSGGVITSGQGTDTVKISWNTAGAQVVTVNYTNANGCIGASATSYPITVHPLPNPGNFE